MEVCSTGDNHKTFSTTRFYLILKRHHIALSRSYSFSDKFPDRSNFPNKSNLIKFPRQTFLCGGNLPPTLAPPPVMPLRLCTYVTFVLQFQSMFAAQCMVKTSHGSSKEFHDVHVVYTYVRWTHKGHPFCAEARVFCVEIVLLRRNVTLFRGNMPLFRPDREKEFRTIRVLSGELRRAVVGKIWDEMMANFMRLSFTTKSFL